MLLADCAYVDSIEFGENTDKNQKLQLMLMLQVVVTYTDSFEASQELVVEDGEEGDPC